MVPVALLARMCHSEPEIVVWSFSSAEQLEDGERLLMADKWKVAFVLPLSSILMGCDEVV